MKDAPQVKPFQANIQKITADNTDFRRVLYTGVHTQLVVMSIPVGGEIGEETHNHVEQVLYIQSGSGEAILNDATNAIVAGDVVVVPPGVRHNIVNRGHTPLKITTVYSPANHIEGRIQHTAEDAGADFEDEEFGSKQ